MFEGVADLCPSAMMQYDGRTYDIYIIYNISKFYAIWGTSWELMQRCWTNGKNDGKMEGIPVDLDKRTVKTVANGRLCEYGQAFVSAGIVDRCC